MIAAKGWSRRRRAGRFGGDHCRWGRRHKGWHCGELELPVTSALVAAAKGHFNVSLRKLKDFFFKIKQ
jgi:hypothetical protein